jgi:glycerol-3-phosphate dehydrogenase
VVLERDRFPTQGAFIFTSKLDGRAMFVIPWANRTILGTTDVDASPESDVAPSAAEVDYLLESANQLCPGTALGRSDVVSTWAGLRPLLRADGSPSARSREERLEVDGPVYTLAGGKLTAFRAMAEPLGARLARDLGRGDPSRRSPTRGLFLWGALDRQADLPAWSRWPGLDGSPPGEEQLWGWALERRYGRFAALVRQRAESSPALDAETRAAEIDWAVEQEHCLSAEDFLVRRTDLGYAPLAELDRCLPQVFARLSAALGWGPAELAREHEAVGALLERLHGWRDARGPGH